MDQNFKSRLIHLRKGMKLSQQELGDKVGVTKAMVSLWEKGAMPRPDKRSSLANALGTTETFLFYGVDDVPTMEGEVIEDFKTSGFTIVPSIEEGQLGSLKLSNSTFAICGVKFTRAGFYRITDNSMSPILPLGGLVVVDKDDTKITSGSMYLIKQFESIRIAYVYNLPGNRFRIKFANIEEYPEEVYSDSDDLAPVILGRVFHYSVTLPKVK